VSADSTCVGSYDDEEWGDVSRTIPMYTLTGALSRCVSLPLSADVRGLADLRLT